MSLTWICSCYHCFHEEPLILKWHFNNATTVRGYANHCILFFHKKVTPPKMIVLKHILGNLGGQDGKIQIRIELQRSWVRIPPAGQGKYWVYSATTYRCMGKTKTNILYLSTWQIQHDCNTMEKKSNPEEPIMSMWNTLPTSWSSHFWSFCLTSY